MEYSAQWNRSWSGLGFSQMVLSAVDLKSWHIRDGIYSVASAHSIKIRSLLRPRRDQDGHVLGSAGELSKLGKTHSKQIEKKPSGWDLPSSFYNIARRIQPAAREEKRWAGENQAGRQKEKACFPHSLLLRSPRGCTWPQGTQSSWAGDPEDQSRPEWTAPLETWIH